MNVFIVVVFYCRDIDCLPVPAVPKYFSAIVQEE